MSSSREKLLEESEATYAKQGVRQESMTKMMGNFRQKCDEMDGRKCVDHLSSSLQEIRKAGHTD